MLLQDSI